MNSRRVDVLENIARQSRGSFLTDQALAGIFVEEWSELRSGFDRSAGEGTPVALQKDANATEEGRYYRFSLPARFVRMHFDFFKRFLYRKNPSYRNENRPVEGWAHFDGNHVFVHNENEACGEGEWYRCHEREVFGPTIRWQRLDATPPNSHKGKYRHAELNLPDGRTVETVLQFSLLRNRPLIGDHAQNPEPQAVKNWLEERHPEWMRWERRRQPRLGLRIEGANALSLEDDRQAV